VTVLELPTKPPTGLLVGYINHINAIQAMTTTELKALAQDLRNERTAALRKADQAQACLNSIQQQLAARKFAAQQDTPMADLYGGWVHPHI